MKENTCFFPSCSINSICCQVNANYSFDRYKHLKSREARSIIIPRLLILSVCVLSVALGVMEWVCEDEEGTQRQSMAPIRWSTACKTDGAECDVVLFYLCVCVRVCVRGSHSISELHSHLTDLSLTLISANAQNKHTHKWILKIQV